MVAVRRQRLASAMALHAENSRDARPEFQDPADPRGRQGQWDPYSGHQDTREPLEGGVRTRSRHQSVRCSRCSTGIRCAARGNRHRCGVRPPLRPFAPSAQVPLTCLVSRRHDSHQLAGVGPFPLVLKSGGLPIGDEHRPIIFDVESGHGIEAKAIAEDGQAGRASCVRTPSSGRRGAPPRSPTCAVAILWGVDDLPWSCHVQLPQTRGLVGAGGVLDCARTGPRQGRADRLTVRVHLGDAPPTSTMNRAPAPGVTSPAPVAAVGSSAARSRNSSAAGTMPALVIANAGQRPDRGHRVLPWLRRS